MSSDERQFDEEEQKINDAIRNGCELEIQQDLQNRLNELAQTDSFDAERDMPEFFKGLRDEQPCFVVSPVPHDRNKVKSDDAHIRPRSELYGKPEPALFPKRTQEEIDEIKRGVREDAD